MSYVERVVGKNGQWSDPTWEDADGKPVTPKAGDNVYIYGSSQNYYTTTSSSDVTVGSLSIDPIFYNHDTLDILGGVFTVGGSKDKWGGTLSNRGTIDVERAATLKLVPTSSDGAVRNGGTINVSGKFEVANNTNLTGSGDILLHGGRINNPSYRAETFTNTDNRIIGNGSIEGNLLLKNEAKGIIDATLGVLETHGDVHVVNSGLMETTRAGTLRFWGDVENSRIIRTSGGEIDFLNFYEGQELRDQNSGWIAAVNGGRIDVGPDTTIVNTGVVMARDKDSAINLLTDATIIGGKVDIGSGSHLSSEGTNNKIESAITNNGQIWVGDGKLTITGVVTGNGEADIFRNGKLELGGAFAEKVSFANGAHGALTLDHASSFHGTVAGLAVGDTIDLADMGFARGNTKLSYTSNGNTTLTVTDAQNSHHIASVALLGHYMASSLVVASDGGHGTLISVASSSGHQQQANLATPH